MSQQDTFDAAVLRTDAPHSARVWNYWIGGKDYYEVDRRLGDDVIAVYPQAQELARASRGFQTRAVRHLAAEAGIGQFLDIGTGLPVAGSTHEVAQASNPAARIAYVDNDPLVLAHARALLTSTPQGRTQYIAQNFMDTEQVLREARETLDLSQPVAVMVLSTLGHVEPAAGVDLLRRYMAPLVSGSYLVLCDTISTPATVAAQEAYAAGETPAYWVRHRDEITASAEGMEMVEPGFGPVSLWRPEASGATAVDQWGFVARKP
ncbi:SAM-dependent methyltransferase [Streptomyces sp. DT24]|uniref:SAM-dependent methyltransferase n=1 Tax=Streptomyces sp. DT24 TaxID=3416520 RepID=UPI003CF725F4